MPTPPEDVQRLAVERARARVERDFAAADRLRDEIAAKGWVVRDTPQGHDLAPEPPYDVLPNPAAIPDRSAGLYESSESSERSESSNLAQPTRPARPTVRRATIALLVEGWPDDLTECVAAILEHAPDDVLISALDLGNVDGAGDALHELAVAHPGRIEEWHVATAPHARGGPAGWGATRTALLRADTATAHIVMETSTILTGDAITPLLEALDTAVAAGWRGADPDSDHRSFHDAGPGEVAALLGHLLAVRREAALQVGGFPAKARFYRNADLEFSLTLRAVGRVVVPAAELPVRQTRHRGYHDSEPVYREKESKRNYDRVLRRLRGSA